MTNSNLNKSRYSI